MNARVRLIELRNGITIETPTLIPALSSAAMGPIPFSNNGRNLEPTACSLVHSNSLIDGWDGVLSVSAFDIYSGLLTDSEKFSANFLQSRYAQHQLIVIDSGEYETKENTGNLFSGSSPGNQSWTVDLFIQTIDGLDPNSRALVVNWSRRNQPTYGRQVQYHQEFFGARRHLASTILLRPLQSATFHQFNKLNLADAADMRTFDIIGVTEKELGDSVLDRLVALATLRKTLDAARVCSPIHVFGGLDPLYTPLLFAAGAELFDGLGWLRYSYRNGMPFHRAAGPVIDGQVDKRWYFALASAQLRNLDEIRLLAGELQVFAHNNGEWSKIRIGDQYLKSIFERFQAKFEGAN